MKVEIGPSGGTGMFLTCIFVIRKQVSKSQCRECLDSDLISRLPKETESLNGFESLRCILRLHCSIQADTDEQNIILRKDDKKKINQAIQQGHIDSSEMSEDL
jgi:hypothetical protein